MTQTDPWNFIIYYFVIRYGVLNSPLILIHSTDQYNNAPDTYFNNNWRYQSISTGHLSYIFFFFTLVITSTCNHQIHGMTRWWSKISRWRLGDQQMDGDHRTSQKTGTDGVQLKSWYIFSSPGQTHYAVSEVTLSLILILSKLNEGTCSTGTLFVVLWQGCLDFLDWIWIWIGFFKWKISKYLFRCFLQHYTLQTLFKRILMRSIISPIKYICV